MKTIMKTILFLVLLCAIATIAYWCGEKRGYKEGFQMGQMHTMMVLFNPESKPESK
jgi:mannose/fructose/N-acetylgalactosamine-specific phosphotransferase system component IID